MCYLMLSELMTAISFFNYLHPESHVQARGLVRIDLLRFLAGCHTRRLNQVMCLDLV